ncbi:glycoside hydrolase family 32 protein [Paenibacillus sp. CC-CFT747]|nr:glycoside hydrolase family 32 protein [Paenibacillus sp. CC-CFT747]
MTQAYKDPFRPQFHFTPEANWMNDPNGMVYYEGEYHLFYQYYPGGTTWGPMHWGHAVSRDLVRWEHLPVALAPDDNGYIFSGSAVVDRRDSSGLFGGGSGLVAIFTHHRRNEETGEVSECQSIAYSTDRGRSWTKYAGNPVLAEKGLQDFRDPKVFRHEPTNSWIMVIAAGDHIRLYRSPDLLGWTFASAFGSGDGSHDAVWECPDLFELPVEGENGGKRWVLIVSIGDRPEGAEGSRTQYFIGEFDGFRFLNENAPETILWVDHGRDNYAGVTWSDIPDIDGRRIYLGWMSNWRYANQTPTVAWRSAMTVPRELGLRNGRQGVRLIQCPVRELQALRKKTHCQTDLELTEAQKILDGCEEELLELAVDFRLGSSGSVGLRVRASDREETVIRYDAAAERLSMDRTRSGRWIFIRPSPAGMKPLYPWRRDAFGFISSWTPHR